jgi:hypothetical protein
LAQKLSILNLANPAESQKIVSCKTLRTWNFGTMPSHLLGILSPFPAILVDATLPWRFPTSHLAILTSRGVRGALNHYPRSPPERCPWIWHGASRDTLEGSNGSHRPFLSQVGICLLPPILDHVSHG